MEGSVEPFLDNLIRYQELSLEIASLDSRLAEIPGMLQVIDAEQQAARSIIDEAKARHDESLKSRRDLERQLQDLEGKVEKYNDQSREVKTNEQYRAIMAEIQAVKDKIGDVEEKILLSMEETDGLEKRINEAEKQVAARKPEFDSRRKALNDERAELDSQRGRLVSEKESLTPRIRPELMEAYERVSSIRGDVALARVGEERCMACNVRLRPALLAEIRKNDAIHYCESCRRILYWIPPEPEKDAAGTDDTPAAPPCPAPEAGANPPGEAS